MRVALFVPAALATAVLAGCGATNTVTVTVTRTRTVTTSAAATGTTSSTAPACTDADLQGRFAVVPGSAGAGQISYELTVTNASTSSCFVSGLPAVRLLDAAGAPLPTHVSAAHPGRGAAARIVLASGGSAGAQARFSPDIPGAGEQHTGACEPKATTMRVSTTGPATLDVPVRPPTSVCEHGALSFDLFTRR